MSVRIRGLSRKGEGEAYAQEAPCRNWRVGTTVKLYRAVLLHALIRFARSLDPLAALQSSKHRSDSFFDWETIIKAEVYALKWNIGAPSRVKSNRQRLSRCIENFLREEGTWKNCVHV